MVAWEMARNKSRMFLSDTVPNIISGHFPLAVMEVGCFCQAPKRARTDIDWGLGLGLAHMHTHVRKRAE